MTRGKYAARAANRLAELDNQLVRDKITEVEQLTSRVTELEAQLQAEKRDRESITLQRAEQLAAEHVQDARQETQALRENYQRNTRSWIKRLTAYFYAERVFPGFWDEILAEMMPDELERSAFIEETWGPDYPTNRELRRHSAQAITRGKAMSVSTDDHIQRMKDRARDRAQFAADTAARDAKES
jgi:hypothetical protein